MTENCRKLDVECDKNIRQNSPGPILAKPLLAALNGYTYRNTGMSYRVRPVLSDLNLPKFSQV